MREIFSYLPLVLFKEEPVFLTAIKKFILLRVHKKSTWCENYHNNFSEDLNYLQTQVWWRKILRLRKSVKYKYQYMLSLLKPIQNQLIQTKSYSLEPHFYLFKKVKPRHVTSSSMNLQYNQVSNLNTRENPTSREVPFQSMSKSNTLEIKWMWLFEIQNSETDCT